MPDKPKIRLTKTMLLAIFILQAARAGHPVLASELLVLAVKGRT